MAGTPSSRPSTACSARPGNGTSGALVLRGDPGIGKTALLAQAAERASGFRVIRATGVEEESGAAVRRAAPAAAARCSTGSPRFPTCRRRRCAARSAWPRRGRRTGSSSGSRCCRCWPSSAADQPLLCVVDDAQWLDRASADALLFAARRLDSESVVLLLVRPSRRVSGRGGARAAAARACPPRPRPSCSPAACQPAAGTGCWPRRPGNPLALLELPRVLTELRGEGPAPADRPPPGRLREPAQPACLSRQDGAAGRGGRGHRRPRPDPARRPPPSGRRSPTSTRPARRAWSR